VTKVSSETQKQECESLLPPFLIGQKHKQMDLDGDEHLLSSTKNQEFFTQGTSISGEFSMCHDHHYFATTALSCIPLFELKLELIQTHMVQKPMLRVEGEKSACVVGVLV